MNQIDLNLLSGIQKHNNYDNIQNAYQQGRIIRGRRNLSEHVLNADPDMSQEDMRKHTNMAVNLLGGYDPERALELMNRQQGKPPTGNFLMTQELRQNANTVADQMEAIAQKYIQAVEKTLAEKSSTDIANNDFRIARDLFRQFEPEYNTLQNEYVRLTGKKHEGAWDLLRKDLVLIDSENDNTRDSVLKQEQFEFAKKKEFDSIKEGAMKLTNKILDAYGLISGAVAQWNKAFDANGAVVNATSLNAAIKMWVRSLDNSVVNAGELQGLTDGSVINMIAGLAERFLGQGVNYTLKDLQSFRNSIVTVTENFQDVSSKVVSSNIGSASARLRDLGHGGDLTEQLLKSFGFNENGINFDPNSGQIKMDFGGVTEPKSGYNDSRGKGTEKIEKGGSGKPIDTTQKRIFGQPDNSGNQNSSTGGT